MGKWELPKMEISAEQFAIAVRIAATLTNWPNTAAPKSYGLYHAMSLDTLKTVVFPAAFALSDVHFRHLHPKRAARLLRRRHKQFDLIRIYAAVVESVALAARKKQLR